jgi:hypothetical protein
MAHSKPKRHANPREQIATAQQVIDAAMTDATVQAFLADYGCGPTCLQRGLQLYLAAQQTQRSADESLAALTSWMAQFVLLARVALQQRPDLMKQLDI